MDSTRPLDAPATMIAQAPSETYPWHARTVTVSALIRRINRRLAQDERTLRKTRGDQQRNALGTYHLFGWRTNEILQTDVDPERFGRELGAMGPHETLAEEVRAEMH